MPAVTIDELFGFTTKIFKSFSPFLKSKVATIIISTIVATFYYAVAATFATTLPSVAAYFSAASAAVNSPLKTSL